MVRAAVATSTAVKMYSFLRRLATVAYCAAIATTTLLLVYKSSRVYLG